MKLLAAAVQLSAEPMAVLANLDRADEQLRLAHSSGVELAVLPEMYSTGYGRIPDYAPIAEDREGPTANWLLDRAKRWGMSITLGFVEREGHHLYDALAFATPDGGLSVYRKRHLVFWESSRFRPGTEPLIVKTRWGRIGFAVCADMIYKQTWADYRGKIDIAVIAAAWPDFACRLTGRKDWLLGHVGPLSANIPSQVAADLGIPVIFANQCGPTTTFIPILRKKISDLFAGRSSITDGQHGSSALAGRDEQLLIAPLTIHALGQGPHRCRTTSHSESAESSFASAPQ